MLPIAIMPYLSIYPNPRRIALVDLGLFQIL